MIVALLLLLVSLLRKFTNNWYVTVSFIVATKIEQESKFNDPEDECSVLVASDAIGMGLNL